MSITLFVIGAILLLTVLSGVYIFLIGFVRKKDVSWMIENEVRKTPFGEYYDHIALADSWIKEHNVQGLTIQSTDGLRLHGLWVPAVNPKGTILLAHGYRSTYLVDFGPALAHYHERGLNLLIPEQRAHGESEGQLITFGVKESDDMTHWLAYHNKNFGNYPVILSGLSMGASTVIYMTEKDLPENVKGVIADCGFTSPAAILAAVFRKTTHLPALPALCITELLARLVAGISLWQCNTAQILAKSDIPIAMIHGTNDDFVPCDMTRQGFDACTSEKQLLLVDGATHGVSFLVAKEKYIAFIDAFLKKTLGLS